MNYLYVLLQVLTFNFNIEFNIPNYNQSTVSATTPSISHSLVPNREDSIETISTYINSPIIDLIADLEGFSSKPAYCGGWAIGYGHAIPKSKVQYYRENPVSREQAYKMLLADFNRKRKQVEQFFWERYIELTPNQLDALASIAYNTGFGRFKQKNIVIKILSTKDASSLTEDDFLNTITPYQRKRLKGLIKRRKLEYQYFIK